jgi:hypothetical protein
MCFLTDYIRIYENAMPHDLCDEMIERFESSEQVFDGKKENSECSFSELNVTKDEAFKDIQPVLMKVTELAVGKYQSEVPSKIFPEQVGCELFRMKKYRPEEDLYPYHVDVNNYASAKRFLSLIWYLNDVEKGGDTFFPHPNVRVQPKRARLLVFPSMWMYPHVGEKPVSNAKYIVGTYLHYV